MKFFLFLCSLSFVRLNIHLANALPVCSAPNGEQFWWDGENCVRCGSCPPGQGVQTICSRSQDTVCKNCSVGSYSEVYSTTDKCIPCYTDDSLCGLPGIKTLQTCTPTTKPICGKCESEQYFSKVVDGCMPCSPPCTARQTEVQSCSHEHNRVCQPRPPSTPGGIITLTHSRLIPLSTQEPATSTPKSPLPEVTATPSPPPGVTMSTAFQVPDKAEAENDFMSFLPSPWNFVAVIGSVLFGVMFVILCCKLCKQRRKRRKGRKAKTGDAASARELVQLNNPLPALTMDSPVQHLPLKWREHIAQGLVNGDKSGFDLWKLVAENLGFRNLVHSWDRLDNPVEELLKAYQKTHNSTVLNFVRALRNVGATHLAMEIEQGINQGLSSPSELYAAAGNQSTPHGNADISLVSRSSSVDDDVSTTGPSGCLGGSVVQVTQV